jgi:hypothetical protein
MRMVAVPRPANIKKNRSVTHWDNGYNVQKSSTLRLATAANTGGMSRLPGRETDL